jgi:hypothetical protein
MPAALAVAQRVSTLTLRPMVRPKCQFLEECPDQGLKSRIIRSCRQEHPDAPYPLRLLRRRCQRPRRCAPKPRNEVAPPHS